MVSELSGTESQSGGDETPAEHNTAGRQPQKELFIIYLSISDNI